ncbi:MAG: hypothetical protein ABIU05_12880, partial [Nitrospirales bacterium]
VLRGGRAPPHWNRVKCGELNRGALSTSRHENKTWHVCSVDAALLRHMRPPSTPETHEHVTDDS